jgi:hypothetical protein
VPGTGYEFRILSINLNIILAMVKTDTCSVLYPENALILPDLKNNS